jgi:DNA-binding CsgD family transcriptional regulator/uncharacterized protein (DUF2384 family)
MSSSRALHQIEPTSIASPARSASPRSVQSGTKSASRVTSLKGVMPISAGAQLLKITPRQYEVLVLLARGYPITTVSRMLNVSVATAKAHALTLYQRLHVKNRGEAVQTAFKHGAIAANAEPIKISSFRDLHRASGMELLDFVKSGVSARSLPLVAKQMNASQEQLNDLLGFPRTTIARKISANDNLDLNQGELLVGLAKLIGQVEAMVTESGELEGFDSAMWLNNWLNHPNPALGGKPPAALMDTVGGQQVISGMLSQMQSGAYA